MRKFIFVTALFTVVSCGSENSNNAEVTEETPAIEANKESVPEEKKVADKKPAVKKESEVSHTAKPDSDAESKVMSMVMDLPEVKAENDRIEKLSKGKSHLSTIIGGRPSDDAEYYTVKLGENTDMRFVSLYLFNVYPDNSIMVYDPVEDKEITVKKWSKSL